MVSILKSSNLYKCYKKNILKNASFAFISSKNFSKTVPLPDLHRLSNSQLKDNVLKSFCAPTSICESILAGNPQSVDRCDRVRHDIIKKWEHKEDVNPKTHPTILLGITMLGEFNKN